jgi:hypothetical protein
LPDPSALPSEGTVTADGWGIVGEVKIGDRYRTYEYINPSTAVSPIPGYAIKIGDILLNLVSSAAKRAPTTALTVHVQSHGTPLPGARVEVAADTSFANGLRIVFADSLGISSFDSVTLGRAFIRIRSIGYLQRMDTVAITGRMQPVSVEMKPSEAMAEREEQSRIFRERLALARSRPRHWNCFSPRDTLRSEALTALHLRPSMQPYLGIADDTVAFLHGFRAVEGAECVRIAKAVDRRFGLIDDELRVFGIGKTYWFPRLGYGTLTDRYGKVLIRYVVPD